MLQLREGETSSANTWQSSGNQLAYNCQEGRLLNLKQMPGKKHTI